MPDSLDIEELEKSLDPAARAVVKLLRGMLEDLRASMARLEAENAELKRLLFGRKAERKVMPSAKREAARRAKEQETEEQRRARQEKSREARTARRKQRKKLPVVEEKIQVPADEKACPCCGGTDFRPLGDGVSSEQYEYVPAKLVRRRLVREKLVCKCGETVITAPAPAQVTEGAEYGPGLHAHVVVSKCADAVPFYRQAKQLERAGVPMSRSTLGDLFHRSADLLKPLRDRLVDIVAESPHVSADETRLPVQENGGCRNGFVWTFLSDPIVTYVYSNSRSGKTPARILEKTAGVLQVDGYTGYNKVTAPGSRRRAACWAHVRRDFFRALETSPEEAAEMMDLIGELYDVEHSAREESIVGTEAHRILRDTLSRPVVIKIKAWLDEQKPLHRPKSPIAKAIGYALGQWQALQVFLDDPKVAIDNNASERALRIVALGRKNFLFAGNDGAADNLAVLQTLVSTCLACDINPQEYLADVLVRVNSHPAKRIDELLPMNWQPPDAESDE